MSLNHTTNTSPSHLPYLPWTWTITPSNTTTSPLPTCPSESSILGTFAAVNGIVSALSVLFGHRLILKKLTCGCFGKHGSRAWLITWTLPLLLQLSSNAIIGLMIKSTKGYLANFQIWELMLFLVARPRLGWIVLGVVALKGKEGMSVQERLDKRRNAWVRLERMKRPFDHGVEGPRFLDPRDYEGEKREVEYPWFSAFMSQFIAEFILQIIALYIMGKTAHFAASHNFYVVSTAQKLPRGAYMMYAGALYYLVTGSIFLLLATCFVVFVFVSRGGALVGAKEVGSAEGQSDIQSQMLALGLAVVVSLLISTWMGSWIFWAGFVRLAGDLYCPPKLFNQGLIWTIFSSVGIILGAGA